MPGGIVASPYDPATGIITLSGSGTLAEYQTAIHAITFANSGENPSSADRTIDVYVTDGKFPSDVATATIHVTPVNDAPLASNDSGSAAVGAAIVIDVLANDVDPDNALDPATVHIIGTASNGASLTVAGEGVWSVNAANGKITFTPASGFIGAPTAISYTVADVSGAISNAATVTVMPILSSPHVDLSGPSAYTGAFLYGHGTAPYASGAYNPTTISSVGNEVAGAGVGLSYDGSSVDVSGVTSTSLTQAVAQNDYISMSFTTQAGIPETWIQNTVNRITYGTFEFAVAISTDGFKSATLLSQNNPGSNYSGPFYDAPGSSYPWSAATDFKLAPGATYEVRVYLYNAAAGTARWDDFYVFYSNDPTGHVTTFNAGGAAVSIAAAAVEIEDANHANMVSGSIVLANKQASDHFSIGGVLTGNGSAGTINGIHYAVTESAGTISVALSGAATKAQYAAFINGVTFQNTSSTPAVVDRTINVTVSDGVETSNVATTIVHVNVAPDIAVSLGDKSGLDGNSVSIVTKGAFSDANGDALTFSAAGLPAWLTIDPATGKITGTLPADASIGGIAGDGVYALDVTATDPQGLSVTDTFNFSAHNVAPVASNNAASTFEDDPVTFDVRGNDHDGGLDSDALEVSAIDGHAIIAGGAAISVSHGSILLGLDGKLTFTPDANFNGSASFGYTVSDGQGGTAKAVVTVTVALVNDAPAGADSTVNTPEDVAYVLSASDFGLTDPLDSPTNTFAAVMIASLPGSGALTLNGLAVAPGQTVTLADISAGKLLWTPAANTNGAGLASLTFQVQDNGGTLNGGLDTDASPNTLTLDVTPVNDPPAIVSDDNDLIANDPSAATGSVVANDSDIDVANVIQVYDIANSSGQPVVVTAAGTVIAGDYGTLTIHQDGTYSYVLDTASAAVKALKAGDPLTDVFSYTGIDVIVAGGVTTPQGGSGTTSLTITITGVNDAPHVALGGTQSPLVNGSFEIDADGDGAPDGWEVANHIHGTEPGIDWVMPGAAPDGSYYAWLNDQPYGTASSNFYQDVPTVPGQIYTLSYLQNSEHIGIPNTSAISVYTDGVLVGTTTFSTIGAQPWESHTFTFTATDANTRIEFRDATNYGANGWVSGSPVLDKVSLLPGYEPPYENTFTENGSPVSIADIASDVTDVDDTHIASAVIVLTNAKPGDLMSIAGALPGGILANIDASVPGMVTITLTGSATKADYNLAIEAIHFENTSDNPDTADRLIDVTVNDGALNSNTAVATIHVVPVNDPPVLTLDPDNSQGGADNGGVDAGHPVGSPPVLISDADVFISDLDSTAIASLTIVVVGVADGAAEHIHVGGASGVDIVLDGVTAHSGTVTVGGTTFVVTYDPATGAITVTNNAGGTISIADTQSLIAATTYQDTSATATEGPRTIELTVNDGAASSSAVSAIIDVHGGVIGAEDTAIPLGVNPADFAAVIDTFVTVAGVPAGALLSSGTLNTDGTWTVEIADLGSLTLTPPLNYNGAFSVEVCGAVDATSTSATNTTMAMSFAAASSTSTTTSAATAEVCRTFDITVTPVNDAPVDTVPTPQTVDEDGTLIFSAANGNAIIIADPDADAGTGLVTVDIWADHGLLQLPQTTGLDFTVLESQIYSDQVGGAGPQAVIHMTGTLADINAALEGLKYAPDANYHGPTDLHIRTSDNGNTGSGGAQTVIGTVAITVMPTVDAVDDSVTTPEDTAVIVTPMDNDSFGGDGATTAVGAASHGTTAINVDGTITYTPNANYNGMDSFTYTVTANTGGWTYQAWSNATTVGVDPFQSADQVFANFPTTTPDSAGNTMTLSPDGVHVEAGLTAQLDVAYQNQWLQFDSNLLVGQAGTYTFSMPPAPYGHFAVDDGVQVFIDGAVVYQVSDVYGTDPVANGVVTLAAGQHTIEVRYFNWYGQSDLALTIAGPDTGNAAIDLATDPNIGVTVVTETATVNVTITPVNDAPIAVNDTGTASEDGPATGGNVISGPGTDTDIDGGSLYVSSVNGDVSLIGQPVAGSTGGSFVLKADGTWTFDPGHAFDNLPAGQTRDTVITYRVADGMGGHATATVTVTVTGVNDAPVTLGPIAAVDAVDAAPVTPIDASVAFDNPGHLPLVYSASNLPAGLSIDPVTGLITGAPAHDASVQGPYVVMVTATGPSGETSTTALQINVANPAPVAVADNAATPADTPVTIAPLANDTDADHDALSITAIGVPANGTATLNPDGTINYVPNAGFVGAETISYTIADSQGGTSTATITIVVGAAPADAPVMTGPAPDQMGTDGSPITPVNVSTFFADPNGQPLAFTATGLPMGLVIDPVTGIISGTPAADASVSGPYSVVVTAVDADGNQISTTVLFAIANPAPVAMIDYSATPLDTPVTISVLANDNDPDGDVLTVISVTPPTNGAAVLNPDGTVTYTPNAGYTGPDAFTYTVSDGQGGMSVATANVFVEFWAIQPVVDSSVPTAAPGVDGAPISPIDIGSHVVDQFGTPLTFAATGLPAGLVIDPTTGVITGTLNANASTDGPFTVTVIVVDGYGVQVTIPLVITATNPGPAAAADVATTAINQPVVIGVLANDTDPDHDALTVTSTSTPAHGIVVINANGSITFTPDAGFIGTDTFTYTVTDANGATTTATVTVNIGIPGLLSAVPAIAPVTGSDGAPITPVLVAAVFGDPDQVGPLTLGVDTAALPPGITFDPATGTFSGTPANNASQGHTPGQPIGTYVVPVTGTDSGGASTTTYVTFTFTNLPPVAANDMPTVSEDGPVLNGNALGNDHDTAPDSDPLTVVGAVQGLNTITIGTPFTTAGGGVLTLSANGSYTFNPGAAYNGLDLNDTATETITYTITDGNGATITAQLIITINGANDAPLVVNPATGQPIAAGQPVIPPQHGTDAQPIQPISAAGFFKDPDAGNVLTYSVVNLPKGLHFNPATGLISGVLDTHASVGGPFTVEVTATDNHGGHSTATFVWVIDNPLPVAVGEVARTTNGVALNSTVAGNDVDPDHDGISYRVETGPSHGVLTLNPDGTYTYLADSQFSGGDSFTYAVVDADGGVAYAVCRITVDPAINIAQHSGGGAGHNGGHTDHIIELPFRLGTDDVREYVHPVASADGSEMLSDGVSEHIRLVVEGRTHQLDQQYGAGRRGVPLHWNLGLGRDGGQDGGTIYEPLGDTPFWHGLNPLDFSGLAVREADVGNADASQVAADADHAVPFGDRLAYIRGRFDREALHLMTDLEDAA